MKYNFIHIKLKEKNNINLNRNKIIELYKLSFGNNKIDLNYNKIKKDLNQNIQIIDYKNKIKKNIGKIIYSNL